MLSSVVDSDGTTRVLVLEALFVMLLRMMQWFVRESLGTNWNRIRDESKERPMSRRRWTRYEILVMEVEMMVERIVVVKLVW